MAVAHDAATESATFTTTTPHTFTHTPTGTPKGVILEVAHGTVSTDLITGTVSYGGVAMERVGTAADTAGEPGRVYLYFLGAGVPTGTQTVSISHTGSSDVKHAAVATVTAASDTEVGAGGSHVNTGSMSFILGSGPDTTMAYGAVYSSEDTPSNLVAGATLTELADHDFGTFNCRFARQTTAASGLFTFSYTDDVETDGALAAVSIREVTSGARVVGTVNPNSTTLSTGFFIGINGQLAGADLYAFAISRNHTSSDAVATCTDDSGGNTWALVSNDADRKLNVWWKRGVAGDLGATVTVAGCINSCQGGVLYLKGTDGANGDPTSGLVVETNASGNETHASLTPLHADAVVVFAVMDYGNDTNAVTDLSGATMGTLEPEYFERLSSSGSDCRITVTARTLASGATGDITWTQANSTTKSVLFAVRPGGRFIHRNLTNKTLLTKQADKLAKPYAANKKVSASG